jgi:hypothetical protein
VGLGLTGCSGPGGAGNGSGRPDPGASAASTPDATAAKTFSESDLVKILTIANSTLAAHGTVTDNGVLADHPELVASLPARVKAQGGTFSPAACGPLFDKVSTELLNLGNDSGAYSARLVYGTTVLGATSSSEAVDVPKLGTLLSDDIDQMAKRCSKMTFTFAASGAARHYTLTFTKENARTDAAFTGAYSEVTTVGATSVHTVEVLALDGNLLVGYAGISSAATLADGTEAVNAVLDAAKQN